MSEHNKDEVNLDDTYKNIVERQESGGTEPVNLGTVNMDKFKQPEGRDADAVLGYHSIDMGSMPSGGRFYPEYSQISIRAAKVAEIRNFSIVDESNLLDIEEKLNYIIKHCVRFTSKARVLSYKDILEEDRFFILLSIRNLTFPEPENSLQTTARNSDGVEFDVRIDSKYFQTSEIPEEIEKYYSEEDRLFNIETKSFGVIKLSPPTIGIMEVVTDYIKVKQIEKKPWDQSYLQILPYVQQNWRGFNDKSIFKGEVDFQSWNERKYMLVYQLAEKIKVGIQPDMLVPHEDEEVLVPINFRDGIKSLFLIQDLSGELL
jgi:hypothetical protein